jgi:hypothetical protein
VGVSAVQTAKAVAEAKDLFSPKPLRLAARIALAQAEMHTVEKKGENTGQGYKYAREIDVLEQARAALLKHGVVVVPAVPRVEFRAVPTRSGQSNLTDVYPVFSVRTTDTDEVLDCAWYGCGADTTDKGGNKAITASLKYFLIKLLLIPTGDVEADAESEDQVSVKAKKPSAVADFDPAPEPADKAAERRKEVIARAMELSDKTKEKVDDVIKKASSANDRSGKPASFDGKTIAQVGNVAWLDRTLNRLVDQLSALETGTPGADEPPF